MKRTVLLIANLAITLSTIASVVMAQPLVPSVPPLINLQGRATDNVGNPVSDGAHTFTFRIFNVPAAGAALWTEGPVGIPTAGGLFTHQLGSSTPFPISSGGYVVFYDETQLWLEIEVDGNIISPRTQLITTPYTQVANFVETDPEPGTGIVTVRIPTPSTDCHISTYGGGSLQKSQLGNCLYGELLLFDDGTDQTATLTSGLSAGGELRLADNGGLTTIDLHGGMLGDASVIVPTNAVNSGEILDEPGVSNSADGSFNFLSSGNIVYVLDSVDITIPAAGYVEVTCQGYIAYDHVNGSMDEIIVESGKTRGVMDFDPSFSAADVPAAAPTGFPWLIPITSSRLYSEAPGTHRYYFHLLYNSGSGGATQFNHPTIRATYYPTLYGTVVLAKAHSSGTSSPVVQVPSAVSKMAGNVEMTTITMADHNARLEAERAKQMAELEVRIRMLEAQVNTDRLPERGMVGPRKER